MSVSVVDPAFSLTGFGFAEMPKVLRCRYISQEDLFGGRWFDAISALLAQPEPRERPRVDGADVAADEVLKAVL